ncbi:glycosyltransferase, group 1 [Candidatus Symbiothrix dinenymphae]|nr:glycosyltransferase, group 1 [Candidatus Symbiothrix dinenymphae]
MKILYDHQIFSLQKYGGVSKYFSEMLYCMSKEYWTTSVLFSNNEYLKNKKLLQCKQIFPQYWFRGQGRLMLEINKPYSIYRILKGDFDVFHQTNFETYCLPFLKGKPMVTTFHDMNFATYNRDDRMVKLQKKSVARADKIIAISENTKKDLVEMWNIAPPKIDVVYHGIDETIPDRLIGERIVHYPYILYVGRRGGFKNFQFLAKAFAKIKSQDHYGSLKLVCTSEPLSATEIAFLQEIKVWNDIIHIAASEKTMANLYKYAELFVFPSIYEGFGMPILEAMSYGCPSVIAKASCFPEVAKDAAVYFDPYDVDDLIYKITNMLDDKAKRHQYADKGYLRCKDFSWAKTAQGHLNVYQSLL